MKKTMRKIVPAVLMLLISAMLVGTSTYAWFSMNNKVTVTGMNVSTRVEKNLFIAGDTLASEAKKVDSDFKNSYVAEVSGLLEPVSTVDGTNYFYAASTNVNPGGQVVDRAYTAYNAGDLTAFRSNYSAPSAVGYVDYVFQLKAINGPAPAQIRLTKLNLTYGGTADAGKAFRVAMFAENITSADPAGGVGTLVAIFTENGATNFNNDPSNKAVDSATTLANVTYCPDTATAKIDVAAGATVQYKIVMRMWLEGEDTTCKTSTYMTLTDRWALDLEFKLVGASSVESGEVAVQYINKQTTAAKTELMLGAETVLTTASDKITINGVDYNKISGKTLDAKQLYVMTNTSITSGSRIFTIENQTYPTEVTNQVLFVVKATGSGNVGTVDTTGDQLSDGTSTTSASFKWYKADGTEATGTNNAATYSATESGNYYCVITDSSSNEHRSATVELTAA